MRGSWRLMMHNQRRMQHAVSAATSARKLEGKVALITGGVSGIGKATAKLFLQHGCKVVIADVKNKEGEALCKDMGSHYIHCDVTKEKDVAHAVDSALSTHGALDIMFNNAGVFHSPESIMSLDMDQFDKTIATNLRGVVMGIKHAARAMVSSKRGGAIVCTASIASVVGVGSFYSYTISKRGIPGVVKSVAQELGSHGIRVNCVSPTILPTPMTMPYMGDPKVMARVLDKTRWLKGVQLAPLDVANAVLFLASEDGRLLSGHNLVIDGAFTVSHPDPTTG